MSVKVLANVFELPSLWVWVDIHSDTIHKVSSVMTFVSTLSALVHSEAPIAANHGWTHTPSFLQFGSLPVLTVTATVATTVISGITAMSAVVIAVAVAVVTFSL